MSPSRRPPTSRPQSGQDVYTVSRLNTEVRLLLEVGLPMLWVEGELSNLARPVSGHLYFTLKDDRAQVRCAMFRQWGRSLKFRPGDGQHVLVRARVSLYEPRGDYQLIVEHMEEAGEGLLRQRFEALKARLAAEGLFATERKQPIPALPRRIGVVTSPTGAALRDVLKILKRRFPAVPVRIYPAPVQGEGAAGRIAAAIGLADRRRDCEVLIVTRGGGSLEDLWAFNEEVLARAIDACSIPVISAVGHEVDVTISDLVADVRAPTPSAAAELAVPDQATWLAALARQGTRLAQLARQALAGRHERLTWLERRLAQRDPRHRLRQQAQRLDELESRLARTARQSVAERGFRLRTLLARLQAVSPARRLQRDGERLMHCRHRLRSAAHRQLADYRARLALAVRALNTVSPLATLERGYAIVFDPAGEVVRDATTLKPGDTLRARLARGSVTARVLSAGEDEA